MKTHVLIEGSGGVMSDFSKKTVGKQFSVTSYEKSFEIIRGSLQVIQSSVAICISDPLSVVFNCKNSHYAAKIDLQWKIATLTVFPFLYFQF